MELPEGVVNILEKLNKNGFEGYVVGGCVRDYIMGKTPHDYDIATSALPGDVKKIFSHTVDTGIKHGTVTVIEKKKHYELTTYRIDGKYSDNRHPDEVIFTDRLSGDLSRRDFTANAIAYNPQKGYVDLFGGREDIKNKIIRGVGDPEGRFREDALRMMRAVRFSAQLDFDIEKNTLDALFKNSELIKNISIERIREELFKLILSDHAERLEILIDSGMTKYFLPETEAGKTDYSVLSALSRDIRLRLAYILKDAGSKKANEITKRLKWDNKSIRDVTALVRLKNMDIDSLYAMRRLKNLAEDITPLVLELKSAIEDSSLDEYMEMYASVKNDCTALKALAIDGDDLAESGFKGQEIGAGLNSALDYVMKYPERNNKKELMDYVMRRGDKKWQKH